MVKISHNRFLLILDTGAGFWQDMHHVLGQLLAAELANRTPVVFWSKNSMYGMPEAENAFEYFFLPVSGYTVHDLTNTALTWYPQGCNVGDVLTLRPDELKKRFRTFPAAEKDANVIVHNSDTGIEEPARLIDRKHPLCGLDSRELYRVMLQKYIRLQPGIQREIDHFYQENLAGSPVIAVHIRGSDKVLEVPHLNELNKQYPAAIDRFLDAAPSARIFFMTDCFDILAEYKKRYGDLLVHTDCKRVLRCDEGVHYKHYSDKKRKGLDIIKDTWLAAKCDYFIGNGYSNVSRAISELKQWADSSMNLLY